MYNTVLSIQLLTSEVLFCAAHQYLHTGEQEIACSSCSESIQVFLFQANKTIDI